ncbi:MAG: ABC transporter permease, partial [Bacteroidota bacterium]
MLRNYFITALRNIQRHPFFSLVNIVGLSLGMAATLLLFQYVFVEQQYDAHIPQAERVFRLYDKAEKSSATTAPLLATLIKEKFPQAEAAVRVMPSHGTVSFEQAYRDPIRLEDKELLYADAGFPGLFGVKMVQGSGDLRRAQCMLVSESWAEAQFGRSQTALGQRVLFEDQFGEESYVITGIFEDIPAQSHLNFDVLLDFHQLLPTRYGWDDINSLGWAAFYTYVKLRRGESAEQLEKQMADMRTEMAGEAQKERLTLQPVRSIHLTPGLAAEPSPTRDPGSLYILLSLGGFILLIAWLNFVNLSTARATKRAREVGIRKTIGAHRRQLISQFLAESTLVFGVATLLAMLLAEISLPAFCEWSGQVVSGHILSNTQLVLTCLGLFAGGSIAAGAYPAFVLSSYRPVDVLKGQLNLQGKGLGLRRSLVVMQFVISGVLMMGAFAVYHQLSFMLRANLGLDVKEKMIVWGPDRMEEDPGAASQVFVTQLESFPDIQAVSTAGNVPGIGFNYASTQIKRPQVTEPTTPGLSVLYVDDQFQQILGLELIAGRSFDPTLDGQGSVGLINQAALLPLGFQSPQEALNQPLQIPYE